MGSLVGHVAPGFGFLLIGLWHLYNNCKLHSLRPSSFVSLPWFPSPLLRRLELHLIIFATTAFIAMELFIGPHHHHPLDPIDLTIPSYHLHNFEHASISLSFLACATFTFVFDRTAPPHTTHCLCKLLIAVAFAQELLMFHLHSSDHLGVEGQFHFLLQLIIIVSLATTLLGIAMPRGFHGSFVWSASVAFQGVWFIFMGCMLWTPALMFKGCFMNFEDGHYVVRCKDEAALCRAKSLVNLQFSWFLTGMVVFSVLFYLWVGKLYPPLENPEYVVIGKDVALTSDVDDDLDLQKRGARGFEEL